MAKISEVGEKRFRDNALEQELCAYVLRKKPMFVNKLEPEWFSSVIIKNSMKIQRKYKTVLSMSALIAELRKARLMSASDIKVYSAVLDDIYDVSLKQMSTKSANLLVQQIVELFEGRSIMNGLNDLLTNLSHKTVDDMKHTLKELGSGAKLPNQIEAGDYLKGFDSRLERIREKQALVAEGKSVGIPTGIKVFDYMIGGLMTAEFGIIAGQPGVGKSALLQAFASNAWRKGYNVLFVTGEMPKHDIEFRMDADIASIPAQKFRMGNLSDRDVKQWKKAIDKERDLRESFLEVVSFPRNFCCADIEGEALQIQDMYEAEIHLICLDYVNIMQTNAYSVKGAKDWSAQADVIWEVKSMCAEFNGGIGLWTAGQVKDEFIDSQVLTMGALKYARAISETAPIVIGLVKSEDEDAEGILELQILKMRNAPLPDKSILLRPNLEYMRIHEELVSRSKDLLHDANQPVTRHRVKPQKKKSRS